MFSVVPHLHRRAHSAKERKWLLRLFLHCFYAFDRRRIEYKVLGIGISLAKLLKKAVVKYFLSIPNKIRAKMRRQAVFFRIKCETEEKQ